MTYEELEAKCWKLEHENRQLIERYIESEQYPISILNRNPFALFFYIKDEIRDFLASRLTKYKF